MDVNLHLEEVTCASCSIIFGVPEEKIVRLRLTHDTFYCPNGHANVYAQKTEKDKLKEDNEKKAKELLSLYAELKRKDQEVADLSKEIAELKAQKRGWFR